MAIPGNVVRVSMIWQPPSSWPSETAVNTFHLQNQSGPTGPTPDVQYIADHFAAKLIAGFGGVASYWPSSVHMAAVKTYLLDSSGHTTAEGAHSFSSSDVQGSSGGGLLPPEVAVCLSEYSYAPGSFSPGKGRRRGRMYLPYLTQTVIESTGKVTAIACSGLVSGWVTIFNSINTIESASGRTDPMGLVVLSRAAGATFEVLHLAVDDHFDAQRRRQHQDAPVVHTADLTPW
jgi:hypothetical protein